MIAFRLLFVVALGFSSSIQGKAQSCTSFGNQQTKTTSKQELRRHCPEVAIPFTLMHGVPVIRLSVNGSKGELFVVDSGSDRTMLSSDEAPRLKVRLSGQDFGLLPGTGDSAGQPVMAAKSIKLKFGRELILKGDIPAVSLSHLSDLAGVKLTGVIGYDVLRGHPTVIDYTHKVFLIYEDKKFVAPSGDLTQELTIDKNAPFPIISAGIEIDGRDYGLARTLIDTGSEKAMMVNEPFASEHSMRDLNGWNPGVGFGIGGTHKTLHGLPGWIRAGQQRIAVSDVSINLSKEGVTRLGLYDALVGGPVLEGRSIEFDIAHSRIYLVTEGEPASP